MANPATRLLLLDAARACGGATHTTKGDDVGEVRPATALDPQRGGRTAGRCCCRCCCLPLLLPLLYDGEGGMLPLLLLPAAGWQCAVFPLELLSLDLSPRPL